MNMDVIDLRDFYGRPLGRAAQYHISRRIRQIWPDVRGLNMLGLGFATPYLAPFLSEAQRVVGLMPARQGVLHWPPEGKSLTGLVDERELPLEDESMDRVLVVHGLEASESMRGMLRQIWRVLAPGGRVLIVVPNRRGLWARREATPFGHGQPFSRVQLTQLLRESMFSPSAWEVALFAPPFDWRPLLRSASAWERAGHILWPRFSGVIIVEATKQIYAATPLPVSRKVKARVRAIAPIPSPARSMTSRQEEG
ncbi:Methyltransferase type 11 [Parvibaculum lavamentivorans DS-1]|uniref:Methyltransferase type 11 n=1 Tax=Parvibaculum lavamentivorans (strain DS-1 / DSM 13023 / NCIMB 13966) TaxID=402881 RepID=A7HTG5_PARL1|nr:methyltransferase domain-containing protein [Parvibaculum lavamentivorans]ABS63198.1 Methyltransferase type 11 [Parvibaculum lavamentivorans DS-1]